MDELREFQEQLKRRPRKSVRLKELTADVQEARRRGVKGSRWAKEDRELVKVRAKLGGKS